MRAGRTLYKTQVLHVTVTNGSRINVVVYLVVHCLVFAPAAWIS